MISSVSSTTDSLESGDYALFATGLFFYNLTRVFHSYWSTNVGQL